MHTEHIPEPKASLLATIGNKQLTYLRLFVEEEGYDAEARKLVEIHLLEKVVIPGYEVLDVDPEEMAGVPRKSRQKIALEGWFIGTPQSAMKSFKGLQWARLWEPPQERQLSAAERAQHEMLQKFFNRLSPDE